MKKREKIIFLHKNQWGEKYETKEVRRGLAAYLLLRKEVLRANEKNLVWLEQKREKQAQEDLKLEAQAQKTYDRIKDISLFFTLKKNEKGKPLGSVGFKEILTELAKLDFHIQKGQLLDFHPLHNLGENKVKIKLSSKITANLKVMIE